MTPSGPPIEAPDHIRAIATPEAPLQGQIAKGVWAFGENRPMGRIRAYASAGLSPLGGRGAPREFHLLGHAHTDAGGMVVAIEGFNGAEGERWAASAKSALAESPKLAEDCAVTLATPLRGCPFTGVR